ncbi:GGDEF domain-containing protein [Pseudoxanthomonas mexicana]|uniref:sensor domain-containing diguanylate cyclase n=1 Tax=Pseudoxanthomonas mexicana TaxID=128785 RepID=UPI0018DE27E3|nr:GGDEF domain-containing protein [Pseudoxanthomonas mexicana]
MGSKMAKIFRTRMRRSTESFGRGIRRAVVQAWTAVLFVSVMQASPVAFAAGPERVSELLEKAEELRSSDALAFRRFLREANESRTEATEAQREQMDYLNAYALNTSGRFADAIAATKSLLATTTDKNLRVRASALLVNSYGATRQFAEGLRQLERTLEWLPESNDPRMHVHAMVSASILYNLIGQYQHGLDYALKLQQQTLSEREQCFARYTEAEAKFFLGKSTDSADIAAVVEFCASIREAILSNLGRQLLARQLADNGQRKNAISLLQNHLADAEATRYPRLIGETHALLAQYMLEEESFAGAEQHATAAVAYSTDIAYSQPLVTAYHTLYELAQRKGDPQSALNYFRKYAEADKAYLNEIKARELAYQIVRQETLQKSQQISVLDQENQVLQLQRQVDKAAQDNNRLIVILLVLLVASIGYWAFKIKRVQLSLKKMAETDALTGICNRHHFTIRAERALAECARNGEQASLIMFDLDHFKNINDRFGHGTGDWALKEVAEASQGFCRRIDVLGRLGGEEFAILMYGCDLRAAARVAEDCRVRLAQIETRDTGHVFAITGSFGVTSSQHSGYSLAKLLSHADKQLYRAKHNGRNRVCVVETEQDAARVASNVLEMPHRDRAEHLGA